MAPVEDQEALAWLARYVRSDAAKHPIRGSWYVIDPKYALPWIGREYGVPAEEAAERVGALVDQLGGYRHEVHNVREDEVGEGRPRAGASWSEWHVPREALDSES